MRVFCVWVSAVMESAQLRRGNTGTFGAHSSDGAEGGNGHIWRWQYDVASVAGVL